MNKLGFYLKESELSDLFSKNLAVKPIELTDIDLKNLENWLNEPEERNTGLSRKTGWRLIFGVGIRSGKCILGLTRSRTN